MSLNSQPLAETANEAIYARDLQPRVVRQLQRRLGEWLVTTPVVRCGNLERRAGRNSAIHAKLEFLQRTGTFKPRGALSVILELDEAQRQAGITAVSAGNHAIAASFAARALGVSAKVVTLAGASPARIEQCRRYGAELVFADDVHSAFETVQHIVATEGRYLVHPFEGRNVIRGTATAGLEICDQLPAFDAVVVPIGGGGLCAGIAAMVKQLAPACEVIGVEPAGADTMHRSFAAGEPRSIDQVRTIADSLGAPFALPLSYAVCRRYVDRLVRVGDDELRRAMRVLFADLKVAVEPACAASTAALLGPLADSLAGRRVVLVLCGSNIDWQTFERHAFADQDAA